MSGPQMIAPGRDEYWEGWHCEGVVVPNGIALGATITIPTFDCVRGRGPSAAAGAGEAMQGIAMANRLQLWVRGSTVNWQATVNVARFDGDGFFAFVGGPHIAAGALQGFYTEDIYVPYVTFDVLETSGAAPVTLDVWFRLLTYGRGV